jgi:outer membrane protein W
MKNTILFLLFVALSSYCFAQIQKGAGYFEGSLSGTYNDGENPIGTTSNTYTSNSWNVNVSYGHYVTDRFAIGIGGGINFSDYKSENSSIAFSSSSRQIATLFYVSPFIRTSRKITDVFYCFGNLNLIAGTGPTQNTYTMTNNSESKSVSTQSTFGARVTGGLNYFLNRHFALTLSYGNLSYNTTTAKNTDSDEKTSSNQLNLNLGLSSVAIGLQYFINNGSK